MSTPTITIDVVLDRRSAKEVLRAILHAILFHRLFGTVKPKTYEVLDVTVPGVADSEMEQLINDKVDVFWKAIENGTSTNKRGQSWFQVYMGEEDVPWEQWIVNGEMRQPKSDKDFDTTLASTLSKTLHTILTYTSSERGRTAVPLITNATGISPFPIKISIKMDGMEIG
ncbi:autophagy-related protein [Pisolithus tinctorius]|nr:autophagy-related protein [Pisolithus tinctorius]